MIIPIRDAALPESAALLAESIRAGISALGVTPKSVEVVASAWPLIGKLQVDLSGAAIESLEHFPRVNGHSESAVSVEQLSVNARPITVHGMPLEFEIEATTATLQTASLSDGSQALILQKAADGSLEIVAEQGELEEFAHTLLAEQARKNGADLVQTKLTFVLRGPRALSLQAEIVAKMMMMKMPINVSGEVDLTDDLRLQISNLQLTGSGMIAGMARGFLQPHFEKLQGKAFDLGALAFGEIRLHDVALGVEGQHLRLSARFGA